MFPDRTPVEGLRMRQLLDGHLHIERSSRGVAYNGAAAIGGTMPAEHGTRLLRLADGAVCEAAVERWLIGAGAVPVTSEGPQNDRAYVVEFGSGIVIAPGAGDWRTRDEWLASTSPQHSLDAHNSGHNQWQLDVHN
jgi:hypothetical protein